MSSASSLLSNTATGCAVAVAVYALVLGALLTPPLQRFALYAHKINTLFWHDIDNAEQFGFAKGQVTPFTIPTPDGESLYAWHVLPIDAYLRNEDALSRNERPHGPVADFTKTLPFDLLTSTQPPARVRRGEEVHGNAGHVAQGWRTDTYRNLALQPNTHVVTIDYRGFGLSSGSPTEAGLITDGTALANWVMHTARIPPERIVILGQSLGTAVSSAVALNFADPTHELLPQSDNTNSASSPLLATPSQIAQPTAFAGIILVAPFHSLPSLLLTYRLGGLIPLLAPLRPLPSLGRALTSRMIDTWRTADRLKAYHRAFTPQPQLLHHRSEDFSGDASLTTREMGAVQILHARSDMDISYHQTEAICRAVLGEERAEGCVAGEQGGLFLNVKEAKAPRVRVQIVEHGGE
ncbi:hypothetical protein Q7P37_007484 [Cladosporium fusiforme]